MKIINRQAHRDYSIFETMEAGMVLSGAEVKSIKSRHIKLEGAYIRLIGNEAFLVNAEVMANPYSRFEGYDSKRSRKLLLHREELVTLGVKVKQKQLTIIPLACYTTGQLIKLVIGLGKGKKEYDKRADVRRRDLDREVKRDLRGKE